MSLLLNTDAYALPGWAMETCLRLEPGATATSAQVLAPLTSQQQRSTCPTQPLSLFQEGLHSCTKAPANATRAPGHAREQCLSDTQLPAAPMLRSTSSLHQKLQTGSFTNP